MKDLESGSPFKIWFSDPRNLIIGGVVSLLILIMLCLSGLFLWPYLFQLGGMESPYRADSQSLLMLGGIIVLLLLGVGTLIVLFGRKWTASQIFGTLFGIGCAGFYIGTLLFHISFATLPEPSISASILAFSLRVFLCTVLAMLPTFLSGGLALLALKIFRYHFKE